MLQMYRLRGDEDACRMKRLALSVLSLVLLAGLLSAPVLAAALVLSMTPGDTATVTCPTRLTQTSSNNTQRTFSCRAASPTPSPTPTPTASPTPTPTPTPVPPPATDCTGYPEPRVFLEAQGWWSDNVRPHDEVGEHVHVGTCFPWGGTVSGSIDFNVRIIFHNNPATLIRLRPHVVSTAGQSIQDETMLDMTFPGGNGEVVVPVTIDTTLVPRDGWQEFRFFVQARHANGDEQHVSTGWALNLQNGFTEDNYKPDSQAPNFTEGRGWYEGTEYTNARWASAARTTPVSGTWTFNVSLAPGAGGTPVTANAVYVDPNFHAGSSGTTIRSGSGSYVGAVSIDTRTLSNGAHKLVLRADSQIAAGRNSGLLVIPFTVDN